MGSQNPFTGLPSGSSEDDSEEEMCKHFLHKVIPLLEFEFSPTFAV